MPVRPWTDPAIERSFRKGFDGTLHNASDPRPNAANYTAGKRLSTGEFFGPIAVCDFCQRWQMLDLEDPRLANVPQNERVAAKMKLNGWRTYQGRDACPVCSGVAR